MKDLELRVPGFRASGIRCGIKTAGEDLALIVSDAPAVAAGVLTRTTVPGAPVVVSREHLRASRSVRAIVANSGCSNVAMGARGLRDARAMSAIAAESVGCRPQEGLVASTGVIGEPLPREKIRRGIEAATGALAEDGLPAAARAILTTDTRTKTALRTLRIGGKTVRIAGIAKGSGMVEPNLATVLVFVVSDVVASKSYLQRALREAADASLNCLSVDGEGSTSDTCFVLANGCSGHTALSSAMSPGAKAYGAALTDLLQELTRELARDGEGATRLVTVRVDAARSADEARRAAKRIANSVLVKTAIFGGDANWGRILQTIGHGRIALDLSKTEVRLAGVPVFVRGASAGPQARARAQQAMQASEVKVEVRLGAGRHGCTVWSCDLSYDYVKINAEYRT
ncbi:glutamate N-acetyltransferase / amino-acid N-acetyltransferase [Myxococcaceae bacterium]|nr:glutamate N-acetyltransferase / amino-acid N-acetyltransferase [Myxococcaceae bacterium]